MSKSDSDILLTRHSIFPALEKDCATSKKCFGKSIIWMLVESVYVYIKIPDNLLHNTDLNSLTST